MEICNNLCLFSSLMENDRDLQAPKQGFSKMKE
jgi:hypothetical protein